MYGGGDDAVGIFLHRSSDNAIVKGEELIISTIWHSTCTVPTCYRQLKGTFTLGAWGLVSPTNVSNEKQ